MNKTLLVKELRACAVPALVVLAALVLYIAVVVSMFDPNLGDSLTAMMESMPELFAAFGMATETTTLLGFMLNYLYGFLFTVFPLVLVMILVNKLVVQPINGGTLAWVFSRHGTRCDIC